MEKEKSEIVNNLEKERARKRIIITITIIAVLLVILIFIGFSVYDYYKSPEKTLGLGAEIENVIISEDLNSIGGVLK